MKLSEAILIGSAIRPQCYGSLFNNGCSCVMGAALEASGVPYLEEEYTINEEGLTISNHNPLWEKLKELYPICSKNTKTNLKTKYYDASICTVQNQLWRMNDNKVSREEIAEWVKEIEDANT